MKKKSFIFIVFVLLSIFQKNEINAQASKKPIVANKPVANSSLSGPISAIKGVDINLFNRNDVIKLNKEPLFGPKEDNYILSPGIVSDKVSKLVNNYYHLTGAYNGKIDQNYLLKNKNGDLQLVSDQVRQMLNDTIVILDSGRLYNLMEDKFISSTLNNSILRITHNNYYNEDNRLFIGVEGVGVKSQNFRGNPPIVTDILKLGEWNYPFEYISKNIGSLYDRYMYNLAKDDMKKFKRFSVDYYDEFVADNKYSKYIMFRSTNYREEQTKLMLLNKYDAKDYLKIDSFKMVQTSSLNPVYNDSLIIFESEINNRIIKYPFNQIINIETKEFITEEKWDFDVNPNKWSLFKYIFRKFNANEEPTKTDSKKFSQLKLMSENTIDYTPKVLVVFNYKTNKIVSILDKNTTPFETIYDLFLDNTNQYLIVQSKGQRVTFFDLKTNKEVITIRGIANNIDADNNLILNLRSIQIKETKNEKDLNKNLQFMRVNLNDFIANNNFQKEINSKNYELNEFTTKEEFAKITTELDSIDVAKFYAQQKLNEKNILQSKADKIIQPSNQNLISNIESLYKDWYVLFSQIKQTSPEIKYEKNTNFEYFNYDNNSNTIVLKSIETFNEKEKDSLVLENRLYIDNYEKRLTQFKEPMPTSAIESINTDLEYDKSTGKYYILTYIKGLGIEDAKKIKSNQLKVQFNSIIQTKYNTPTYPPIERSFVFRKYNELKGNFGERYEDYPLSIEDTKASYDYYTNPGIKKYVTHFFVLNGKPTKFYDELYIK